MYLLLFLSGSQREEGVRGGEGDTEKFLPYAVSLPKCPLHQRLGQAKARMKGLNSSLTHRKGYMCMSHHSCNPGCTLTLAASEVEEPGLESDTSKQDVGVLINSPNNCPKFRVCFECVKNPFKCSVNNCVFQSIFTIHLVDSFIIGSQDQE